MLEVGVLYSDGSMAWAPMDDMTALRLIGVLTISVTAGRGNRRALVARMWSRQNNDLVAARDAAWWGEDNYAIGVMPDGRFFTTQWADGESNLYARRIADGARAGIIDYPRPWPEGAAVTIFRGAYLVPAAWERALAVFEAEMF